MSLLKNLGDKAVSTAKLVGNKSQDLVEVGKLKMHITQLESDIKKMKADIGEIVYNAYSNALDTSSEQVDSICNSIIIKYAEIEEFKIKIDEVKND